LGKISRLDLGVGGDMSHGGVYWGGGWGDERETQ
jgi:hypothetical protein